MSKEEENQKQFSKFLTNLNSELEEDKATREKYAKQPFKRETYVKLEFSLPILQALILCKLVNDMEKKGGG